MSASGCVDGRVQAALSPDKLGVEPLQAPVWLTRTRRCEGRFLAGVETTTTCRATIGYSGRDSFQCVRARGVVHCFSRVAFAVDISERQLEALQRTARFSAPPHCDFVRLVHTVGIGISGRNVVHQPWVLRNGVNFSLDDSSRQCTFVQRRLIDLVLVTDLLFLEYVKVP